MITIVEVNIELSNCLQSSMQSIIDRTHVNWDQIRRKTIKSIEILTVCCFFLYQIWNDT
jgi:hypothetical protein